MVLSTSEYLNDPLIQDGLSRSQKRKTVYSIDLQIRVLAVGSFIHH